MSDYPFHHMTVKPAMQGRDKYAIPARRPNFYGCDPYNTTDAPRMRVRVSKATAYGHRVYAGTLRENVQQMWDGMRYMK